MYRYEINSSSSGAARWRAKANVTKMAMHCECRSA
jgi:hypothetical protein